MYFSWSSQSLQRTMQRRVLQLRLMPLHRQMCLRCSTNGRRGRWRTLTFSPLGKHSKRLFLRKVGPWRNRSKKSSAWSKSGFYTATRTCSRLGCNFLANHGVDEEPYQFPKKPRKSHKSHPSHPLSHCHPALMGWYSAPLLQCKSSRYDAHCMPSTRPCGTCWFMIAKIYGRRGILGITMAMILLVSWIKWQ